VFRSNEHQVSQLDVDDNSGATTGQFGQESPMDVTHNHGNRSRSTTEISLHNKVRFSLDMCTTSASSQCQSTLLRIHSSETQQSNMSLTNDNYEDEDATNSQQLQQQAKQVVIYAPEAKETWMSSNRLTSRCIDEKCNNDNDVIEMMVTAAYGSTIANVVAKESNVNGNTDIEGRPSSVEESGTMKSVHIDEVVQSCVATDEFLVNVSTNRKTSPPSVNYPLVTVVGRYCVSNLSSPAAIILPSSRIVTADDDKDDNNEEYPNMDNHLVDGELEILNSTSKRVINYDSLTTRSAETVSSIKVNGRHQVGIRQTPPVPTAPIDNLVHHSIVVDVSAAGGQRCRPNVHLRSPESRSNYRKLNAGAAASSSNLRKSDAGKKTNRQSSNRERKVTKTLAIVLGKYLSLH